MFERNDLRRCFATVTVLIAALVPLSANAQRAELEKIIQRKVLPNGLEVIVVENHGVPLATVEIDVKNGSFTQTPEYEGLAHMYEHMFFRANSKYPEPNQFWDKASDLGAVFNASTREEVVNYYMTVPAEKLSDAVSLLATALKTPLFRPDELERERQVVIGEYDRNESSPFFEFSKSTGKALWGSAWSRKDPLGERSVILATTPEKMRFIQQRYYVPNNTALIVTGDITADRAFALAKETLGDWKRGADPFAADPIPPTPILQKDTALILEAPIGTAIIQLQWSGPSASKDPA